MLKAEILRRPNSPPKHPPQPRGFVGKWPLAVSEILLRDISKVVRSDLFPIKIPHCDSQEHPHMLVHVRASTATRELWQGLFTCEEQTDAYIFAYMMQSDFGHRMPE